MKISELDTKTKAAIQILVLAGMILGPVRWGVTYISAQEAQKQNAPIQSQMAYMVNRERRKDNAEQVEECEKERSELQCEKESDHRWAMWGWMDCGDIARANSKDIEKACGPEPKMVP